MVIFRTVFTLIFAAGAVFAPLSFAAVDLSKKNVPLEKITGKLGSPRFTGEKPDAGEKPRAPEAEKTVYSEREKAEFEKKLGPEKFEILPNSDFEIYVNNSLLENFPAKIRQFGYGLFAEPPSTFAPVSKAPATSEYVIAPGDEINIAVWGKIEGSWRRRVDRDGNIVLPKIGVFRAAGLSFETFREILEREFAKYYSGFSMNVSLGSLEGITVYVVGNARRPGAYTVSSLSTLVNALFASGGPNKNGSMRNIKLKRGGKTEAILDLYDFLIKGDKTGDARLFPGDVIYIPPVGAMVAAVGNVKNPAIYEIKGEERVLDLIKMAGGFSNTAFRGRASVKRIYNHKFSDFFEGNLNSVLPGDAANFKLEDGDIIRFYPIVEGDTSVIVEGAVYYPGRFGLNPGAKMKDIILLAGGLLPQASSKAELTRVKITEKGPSYERLPLDIKKAMEEDEKNNIALNPNDYIFIKTVPEWQLYKTVKIGGEVKYPGTYTIMEGETLSDLVKRAGGFTKRAYVKGLDFRRESVRKKQQKNLKAIAERLERQLIVEGSHKIQTALSQEDIQSKKAAFEARKKFVENIREVEATGRLSLKIESADDLAGSSTDIELEDGDEIMVPQRPSVVSVTGAVMTEGSFVYNRGCSWKEYIAKAGGYSDYANKGRIFILRADGSAINPSRFLFFSTKVEPGDTIVVPEKFDRIAWLREVRDLSQILMQIAVTAGVVIKVF